MATTANLNYPPVAKPERETAVHPWVSAEQKLTLSEASTAVITSAVTIPNDDRREFLFWMG